MTEFLLVALGGALGAAGRYAAGMIPPKTEFPAQTLAVNIIGAVAIGFVAGLSAGGGKSLSPQAALFWKTGVCGGFTTFSAFSLETCALFEHKAYLSGALYVVLSVCCCLAGVIAGQKLAALARS